MPAAPFRFFEETLLLAGGTICCNVAVGGSGIVATGAVDEKVSCGAVVTIPIGDDAPGYAIIDGALCKAMSFGAGVVMGIGCDMGIGGCIIGCWNIPWLGRYDPMGAACPPAYDI